MASIVIRLCVLSEVPVPTSWWPWEQLLVYFVFFVKKQLLLPRQTVHCDMRAEAEETVEH
jgi:hypothetical protein